MTFAASEYIFLRDVLGLTVLISGTTKLIEAAAFRRALSTYQIFSARVARILTRALPLTELALAIWLLSGLAAKLSALAVMITLVAFTAVVAWNLARGVTFSCGCFGSDHVPATWFTVLRNLPLIAVSAYLLYGAQSWRRSIGSYDAIMMLLTAAALLGLIVLGYSWRKLPKLSTWQAESLDVTDRTMGVNQ